MNATETIFVLALASNCQPKQHFQHAIHCISALGVAQFSNIYLIPCRDGVGEDYWNAACILKSKISLGALLSNLKQMEIAAGRVRPSHHISLDIDLIAWGRDLQQMQFNAKKLPLALDVKIPIYELWPDSAFAHAQHPFPIVPDMG